jgi:hypothetical protein
MLSIIDGFPASERERDERESAAPPLAMGVALLAVLVVCLLATVACGGRSQSASDGGGATSATTAAPKPPAAAQDIKLFGTPSTSSAPAGADAIGPLDGAPDLDAADEIAAGLKAAGLDLTGVHLYVLPITGFDGSLLILRVDQPATSSDGKADPEPILKYLVDSPAMKAAKVVRLALIFSGTDEQGPFVATVSLPISALAAVGSGELTPELQQAITFDLKRGGTR